MLSCALVARLRACVEICAIARAGRTRDSYWQVHIYMYVLRARQYALCAELTRETGQLLRHGWSWLALHSDGKQERGGSAAGQRGAFQYRSAEKCAGVRRATVPAYVQIQGLCACTRICG